MCESITHGLIYLGRGRSLRGPKERGWGKVVFSAPQGRVGIGKGNNHEGRGQRSHLGVSTGRAGSSLCPTRTRPECGGWIKNWPETDPEIWLDFLVWVSLVSGWFGSVSGLSPGTKFGQIRRDLAEIWPDPSRSGRNMAGSVEIGQKSGRIRRDLAEIWPNPSISGRNLAGSVEIWPRFRRVLVGSRRI